MFKIIEPVPETCGECPNYDLTEHPDYAGCCSHPKDFNKTLIYRSYKPPSPYCPVRKGWPLHYKTVPVNFPENYTPQQEEDELEQARR